MTETPPTPIDRPTWRLPWEMAELHGWFLVFCRHVMRPIEPSSHHEPVRFLRVVMSKGRKVIEAEGGNDMDVWRLIIRKAKAHDGR